MLQEEKENEVAVWLREPYSLAIVSISSLLSFTCVYVSTVSSHSLFVALFSNLWVKTHTLYYTYAF